MNTLKSQIRQILNPIAKRLGYIHWREQKKHVNPISLEEALKRVLTTSKISINTVIDVGAAVGSWSDTVIPFLPEAKYLLIEANSYHEEALQKFTADHPNTQYELAAASDTDGVIYFDDRDPFGGAAAHEAQSNYIELPARSIDSLIAEHNLPAPYLLKLDTHGFEVPILEGASKTLENANLVVIEVYNFQIQDNSLLFHEMCQYMQDRGFRVADICDPLHRELDHMLWQMDFLFIRDNRPEFQTRQFS